MVVTEGLGKERLSMVVVQSRDPAQPELWFWMGERTCSEVLDPGVRKLAFLAVIVPRKAFPPRSCHTSGLMPL